MKLIRSNGRELSIRDVGEPLMIFGLTESNWPLPIVDEIMSDDEARDYAKKLMKKYRRIK